MISIVPKTFGMRDFSVSAYFMRNGQYTQYNGVSSTSGVGTATKSIIQVDYFNDNDY